MLISVWSVPTELNLNALAWTIASGMTKRENQWSESTCIHLMSCNVDFQKHPKSCPVNVYPKYEINQKNIFFHLSRKPCLLSGCSSKTCSTIAKNTILRLSQTPGLMLISLFSAPTATNLKALTWKMASRMTKIWKSVIGSVWAHLMSCKAYYRYHEFGTLDE